MPWPVMTGRRWTRGSPVRGAPTSSSSWTPWARASGRSSSRVGRRWPDSRRERVLTEMPVSAASSSRVTPRSRRRARRRGPTAVRTASRSSCMRISCQIGKFAGQLLGSSLIMVVEVVIMTPHQMDTVAERLDTGDERFDVAVIGGGAAGLSAALTLARSRRRTIVIDAGAPRNAPAEGVHGFLTRDGIPPAELLAIGRQEIERYGGLIVHGKAQAARRVAA